MKKDDIISLLTRILGPLKSQAQDKDSNFDKFQDVLKQSLTQPSLETRRTGVHFPDFQLNMLPDNITEELDKITDEIVAAQATRKPGDPVFWLRERNLAVTAGIEESIENFIEPEFSFGPFINSQSKQSWFDFFQVPKQLRFEIFEGDISDFMIITLPLAAQFPPTGIQTSLSFDDCTIWISVKDVAANADNKYVGVRAKNCEVKFSGSASVQASGFITIFAPGFQVSFQPFDTFATGIENNAQPKAGYPDNITFSFAVTRWSLQSFNRSVINLNGDSIKLEESININPLYLEPDSLIHFPLPASKNSWEIISNDTERFQLTGKANLSDPGWYLPVVSTDTSLGIGVLGMNIFSGYLGFRGKDGLTINWPGLENGKPTINKFLMLTRPGRTNLKYTYGAHPRLKQPLSTWKAISDGDAHSLVNLKPLSEGEGICLNDNQNMEALIQPVAISARVDKPLNANQQRFNISGHQGLILFLKIEDDTSVFVIGSHPPLAAGEVRKRRIPQSLCLRNALLTTDDPGSIFLEGKLLLNEFISEGFLHLVFPVYRLVNTLPDPYISNQDKIFEEEFQRFRELWRNGQDTLPDQSLFSVTSIVQWNDEGTNLEFTINQSSAINRVSDTELLDRFFENTHPCGFVGQGNGFPGNDLPKIKNIDLENLVGSYGFLQWLPGDRSLVDVSGSANQWGVAFSNTIPEDKSLLAESLGYSTRFPFRIKNMDLVSSGRMSRLFTLPHIQWEPVMKIENPSVIENDIPSIINFKDNGAPTRISSAQKNEVELVPRKLYNFIIEGFNSAKKPYGAAAHFNLPFGICAFAYFNPKEIQDLPSAKARINEPAFSGKKTGELSGGMQLHVEAIPPQNAIVSATDNHSSYFIGSARQLLLDNNSSILGNIITPQFNEFTTGPNAKVPLERIDFAGYGASIFSNWLNEKANFGRVSQVKFDVLIGRTAHEVIQIKSILFPWGVPVVRSIVIQRKNMGIVTRYDSGWVAQGPGEFNFLSNAEGVHEEVVFVDVEGLEHNPYSFHPGMVTGIYNIQEIKDIPDKMDITITNAQGINLRFSGVYFNGDIQIENIIKGALPKADGAPSRVHSAGQFGYIMLADPAKIDNKTTLKTLFPPNLFKQLLTDPKVGGSLGGPVNAVMKIAATGQRMQITRVDISPSNEANVTFVVAVRGTIELLKEGSWTVVKCLPSKDIVTLASSEAVPIIRNGLLTVNRIGPIVTRNIEFRDSRHSIGDPAEIDKYAPGAPAPLLQYSFLQTTDTQKLLFRRPAFFEKETNKIFTEVPDLADSFRLLNCNTIFPNLSKALSLPSNVRELIITGEGNGLKFDDALMPTLNNFIPPQFKPELPDSQVYKLIDEADFKVLIRYGAVPGNPSFFKVDLSSDAIDEALEEERKKWETVNKDVAIEVHLGPLKPLLTLTGQFRSEAGKDTVFENPECKLGPALKTVTDILRVLDTLAGEGDLADSLHVAMGNSPDVWNYKMSIDQRIPVIQFPSPAEITLTTPPPLIIEASLLLGVFFNLSLSPDPKNLIKPGAGAVFGFEGMIQIQLITIGIAAAYGVGITKVKAFVDFSDPKPQFEFTFGFGATVIVDLPVVGLASVTRSFSLTGNIDSGDFLAVVGQMLRGVLSLAGGLLVVAIQIEGKGGVQKSGKNTKALFEMIFSLDVSLAFVISYDFTKSYTEEITLS